MQTLHTLRSVGNSAPVQIGVTELVGLTDEAGFRDFVSLCLPVGMRHESEIWVRKGHVGFNYEAMEEERIFYANTFVRLNGQAVNNCTWYSSDKAGNLVATRTTEGWRLRFLASHATEINVRLLATMIWVSANPLQKSTLVNPLAIFDRLSSAELTARRQKRGLLVKIYRVALQELQK